MIFCENFLWFSQHKSKYAFLDNSYLCSKSTIKKNAKTILINIHFKYLIEIFCLIFEEKNYFFKHIDKKYWNEISSEFYYNCIESNNFLTQKYVFVYEWHDSNIA